MCSSTLFARLIEHLLDVKRQGAHSELCYVYTWYDTVALKAKKLHVAFPAMAMVLLIASSAVSPSTLDSPSINRLLLAVLGTRHIPVRTGTWHILVLLV